MMKPPEDTRAFEEWWQKRGRDVRILDFSPDVILCQLAGAFSWQELERIVEFLKECEDGK